MGSFCGGRMVGLDDVFSNFNDSMILLYGYMNI